MGFFYSNVGSEPDPTLMVFCNFNVVFICTKIASEARGERRQGGGEAGEAVEFYVWAELAPDGGA